MDCQIVTSKASGNDLTIYKDNWAELRNRTFFGDKIYQNKDFFDAVKQNYDSEMLTPVKYSKNTPDVIKNLSSILLFVTERSEIVRFLAK